MKPNYKDININAIPKHSGLILPNGEPWETSEHIMVNSNDIVDFPLWNDLEM